MPDIIYAAQFAVQSFGSFSLTGTDYTARFLVDADVAAQYPVEGILSDSVSEFPTYVRTDPGDRILPLLITIDKQPPSQNLIDALKSVFTPSAEIDFLRVRDENGNVRRMRCKSLGLVPWEGYDDFAYVARLQAPEPVWEDDTPDVIFYNVSGNAGTTSKSWEVVNSGNEECYPVVTMTPYANRSGAGAGQYQLPIVIAWRSSLEGVDSQGLPYPIDVTDGAWDTSALADFNGTGSAAYVRAWLDGVEISRFIENPKTANTSVWCSIPFQPTRQAELFANITGSDTELSVTNADDLAAFPDTGFVLVDSECVAYQGKTATSLLGLKRAQRGTTAASHAAGATVYWVEHDIRLTWGDAIPFVAGMELADEKPIIDLAASTNLHHKYGTADGLIAPDTLRSGQWVRELRAPANGRRAQYASLSQAAGVATFTDQLPEADAPNFDSLSLYTPCFTSSNVTGVALDVEVDHHMLMNFYGVDDGGFESLLWKQSIRGPVGPVFSPTTYVVDAPAFDSIEILPDGDLARITIEGRTSIVTGLDPTDISVTFGDVGIAGGSNFFLVQTFTLRTLQTIDEVVFICSKSTGSAMDGTLYVMLRLPDSANANFGAELWGLVGVPAASLPGTTSKKATTIGQTVEDQRPRRAGTIAVQLSDRATATAGRLRFWNSFDANPGGSQWTKMDTDPWLQLPAVDLDIALVSYEGEAQDDASVGTGRFVSTRNVDVHFNPDLTPRIEPGAASPCYILNEEVLTNTDTGESLTLTGVLPIEDASYDVVKIDASGHVITALRDGVDEYEQPAGYFSEPSNIQSWLRLVPGVNHLTFSNLEGGPRLAVRVYLRSRWT